MSYRRRRRRQRSPVVPDSTVLIVILAIGLYYSYTQNQTRFFAILALIALIVVIAVLIRFYLRMKASDRLRNSNIEEVDRMDPLKFEVYIKLLLEQNGFTNVRLTAYYDLGIDVIAKKDGITWGIQVKHYKGKVGLDAVRQAVTVLAHYHCDKAMVMTNSYFTKNAQVIAASTNCTLVNRDELIELILKTKKV